MNQFKPPEQTKHLQPQFDLNDLHRQQAAVVTPVEIAVITGVLFSVVIGISLWLFDVGFVTTIKVTALSGALITLLVWAALVFRWVNLTALEPWFGDLNNDGYIGYAPTPAPVAYTVNTFSREGHMTGQHKYTFTASHDQIKTFCHKTRRMGFPISRRKWVEQGAFSDEDWRKFYGELVAQHLVAMQAGKNVLTEGGAQWADGIIADDDPHYSPTEDAAPEGGK